MNIKVFYISHVQSMSDLFGNVVPVDGNNVLKSIIINDFLKRKELTFINPSNGKTYHRHYAIMPQGGVAVINVGKYVDGCFVYATVGINLNGNKHGPYVVIGCHNREFYNMKLIVNMITQSINWALTGTGTTIKLEPCHEQIDWECDFIHSYINGIANRKFKLMNAFGFEQLEEMFEEIGKRKGRPRKSVNLDDYLPKAMRKEIKAWLHAETDPYMYPPDMMRAVRVLYELGIIKKPTYGAFVKEFDKEQLIAPSTYNGYMNLNNNPYENDATYAALKADAVEKFLHGSIS